MGHADFRVGKRIFATLGYPDKGWAMVKLTPEQQRMLVESEPELFTPVSGGWGRSGSTQVRLAAADRAALESAITMAWKNVAPRKLLRTLDEHATPADMAAFDRARACADEAGLMGIEVSTSYGTPSLRAGGKFLLRMKDPSTLVLRCALEEKEMLIAAAPAIYFETDHYKGWPAILIRMAQIGDRELQHRLRRAWELVAPKKLKALSRQPTKPSPSLARRRRPRQG